MSADRAAEIAESIRLFNADTTCGSAYMIGCGRILAAEVERLSALRAAPDMVLVPREPTKEMLEAGADNLLHQYESNTDWDVAKDVVEGVDLLELHRAMLAAAAPSQPAGKGE